MERDREREKRAEYNRRYLEEHPEQREKNRLRSKQWADENRDRKRVMDRAYYASSEEIAEKAKQRNRDYYKNNTAHVKKRESLRRLKKKKWALDLLGAKCARCDETHPAVLDFHHVDPSQKLFRISDGIMKPGQYGEADLIAEIMKCEVLCKNDHGKEHCTWTEEDILY